MKAFREYKPETVKRLARKFAEQQAVESVRRKAQWGKRISEYERRGWKELAETERELYKDNYGEEFTG
jgi:hypothetical protein